MNNFSVDELTKKDFLTCLGMWIVIELVCFLLFPALKFVQAPGDLLRTWFITSIPLGLGGAFLSAASSRFLAIANDGERRSDRGSKILIGQIMGLLGILGIGFPLFVIGFEFIKGAITNVDKLDN